MQNLLKSGLFYSVFAYSSLSFAGGPLIVQGPEGHTPVKYINPNITVHVESGALGELENADANALVRQAFDLWNTVSTSSMNLSMDENQLAIDINISNFGNYLPSVDESNFNANDNLNPVVYDSDGKIIDAFFGPGQSEFIAGFSASVFTVGASYFNEGYAVINGKDIGITNTAFKLIISHEIAHFLGLDHSQVNISNQESDVGSPEFCSTGATEDYPIMYPFICRSVETLHSDDISALSALYPAGNINDHFGILEGYFVDDTNKPILGANIWAKNTSTGETYSIVSDYLRQCTGYYKLYLPDGNYTLHANSINAEFYGGSSIGPYAATVSSVSFKSPHPITEVSYQADKMGNPEVITLAASEKVQISFTSSGNVTTVVNPKICSHSTRKSGGSSSLYPLTLLLLLTGLSAGRWFSHHRLKLSS